MGGSRGDVQGCRRVLDRQPGEATEFSGLGNLRNLGIQVGQLPPLYRNLARQNSVQNSASCSGLNGT